MEEWKPDQLKASLDKGDKVFLKLWKRGCGICKLSNSATDRMEKSNDHGLTFAKINVDDNPMAASKYGVRGLPTLMIFKGGKVAATHPGAMSKQKITEWIKENT